MYSMYPWDAATWAPDADAPARPDEPEFTAALQFALDRRDNGGDAARRPEPPKGKN